VPYTVTYRGNEFVIEKGQVFDPAVADAVIQASDMQHNEDAQPAMHVPATLDMYQSRAMTTATYPGRGEDQLIYPAIAMCEEAGELAGEVLTLLNKQQGPTRPNDLEYFVADAALQLALACGTVMGLTKKAYRNDPPGVMTAERVAGLQTALMATNRAVLNMSSAVQYPGVRVEFPPVPVLGADRENLVKEVGDVLWYVACFCTEAHVSLGYVGDANYAKLADRAKRDVIRSTGDDR
jgi:MazG nucleotide pyrophosphohydrolase domain